MEWITSIVKRIGKHKHVLTVLLAFSLTTEIAHAKPEIIGISAAGGEFGYENVEPKLVINGVIQHTLKRGTYDYIYPSQSYVDYFVGEIGMDAIRIGARWERIQEVPGKEILDIDPRLLELVEAVERVTDSGAYAILDVHNYGKFISHSADGKEVETNIGDGPVSNQHFAYFWRRMAETFGDNPKVMFELMNEPNQQNQSQLMSTLQAGIDAIQVTGATNTILVPGNRWSGAHSWNNADSYGASNGIALLELTDKFDKLVFVAHQYIDSDYSGTKSDCLSSDEAVAKLDTFTGWLRDNSRRGFLGEFGVSSSQVCLESLRAMLEHVDEHKDVYLGAIYWATGDYWNSDLFYLIRPASLKTGQANDIGSAQLGVLQEYLLNDPVIVPPPMGEIVDQNANNAWYLPGDNRRAWISQPCAIELEENGISRRTGSWNADLGSLTGYSVACTDIGTLPSPPPQGEVIDQDARNAWYLPGDGRRAWINQTCAAELEARDLPRRPGNWNDNLGSLTGYSVACADIGTPPSPPPLGEVVDQSANNAWYIPGDGRRAWINQRCADELESTGLPRRSGNWNGDLGMLTGYSVNCDDI